MIVFLFMYLVIYGGMSAYALWKINAALHGGWKYWTAAAAVAAAMVVLPIFIRIMEERLTFPVLRVLIVVSYIWMVLTFWTAAYALLFDIWNAGVWLAAKAKPGLAALRVSPVHSLIAVACVITVSVVWGVFEARWVRIRTVEMVSPHLAAGTGPVRLVQVSDLHAGLAARGDVLEAVFRKVREADPDLLISTGDILDSVGPETAAQIQLFSEFQPKYGKYAVTGNHEVYPGLKQAVAMLEDVGFTVLRQASVQPAPGITLTGVDDAAVQRFGQVDTDEAALLGNVPDDVFHVLLKHRPTVTEAALEKCDLQLSGHTHQGQVFPFWFAVRLFYPHPHSEVIRFAEGLSLYVSTGAGAWGPPFRVFAPPEITLFLIRSEAK